MKLMMLGETTGNKRSKEEQEFLGANASRFIWEELEKYGLYKNQFYKYSPFGDLGHNKKRLTDEEYNELQIELRKTILMLEPNLTLSVGRLPTEELLQTKLGGKFIDSTGDLLYSVEYDIWFVPTIHPSVCARSKEKLLTLQRNIEDFYEYLEAEE